MSHSVRVRLACLHAAELSVSSAALKLSAGEVLTGTREIIATIAIRRAGEARRTDA
jgi:hypothetical protein